MFSSINGTYYVLKKARHKAVIYLLLLLLLQARLSWLCRRLSGSLIILCFDVVSCGKEFSCRGGQVQDSLPAAAPLCRPECWPSFQAAKHHVLYKTEATLWYTDRYSDRIISLNLTYDSRRYRYLLYPCIYNLKQKIYKIFFFLIRIEVPVCMSWHGKEKMSDRWRA